MIAAQKTLQFLEVDQQQSLTPVVGFSAVNLKGVYPLRVGAACEKGEHRETNEDACYADPKAGVFLVADGVGRQPGGAVAAGMVARIVPLWLTATLKCGWRDAELVSIAIEDSLDFVQSELKLLADDDPDLAQAAATLAVGVIDEDRLHIARVGDCRAYLLREGSLKQLTRDQSFVQQAINAGLITEAEAKKHPFRHLVTNTLSSRPFKEPVEVVEIELQAGDRLLLTTDGVHDYLSHWELKQVLQEPLRPETIAENLVQHALANDTLDNCTALVIEVG